MTDGQYDEGNINFSPDEKEIIFSSNRTENPDANKNTDIWALDIASGKIRQLTTNRGGDSNPRWSHNGSYIAYTANTIFNSLYGVNYLWVVPANGEKPKNLTANVDRNVASRPLWSPDDEYIYFVLEDSGNWHLCRISPMNGKMERIIAGERTIRNPVISPDGKFIAFTLEDALSPAELYIAQTNGEGLKKLTTYFPNIGRRTFDVDYIRYQKTKIIFKLKGIDSIDEASKLVGAQVVLKRDELEPLKEGEYYQFDLIDIDVYTVKGSYLGKVFSIVPTGSNDVYVVKKENKEYLIPAITFMV